MSEHTIALEEFVSTSVVFLLNIFHELKIPKREILILTNENVHENVKNYYHKGLPLDFILEDVLYDYARPFGEIITQEYDNAVNEALEKILEKIKEKYSNEL